MAGYDVRLAVEWNAQAAATYRHNFPRTQLFEGDIHLLSDADALELAMLKPGELDVLDGSPPCQGFSTAGKRRFGDSRNRLFEQYVRMLNAFQPRAFVMENVGGLVKGKMKLAFAEMTLALKAAGYKVCCRLLNAWWYGVAQDRRRLIWIGIRNDIHIPIEPSHPLPICRRPISVDEAFGSLRRSFGSLRNAQFKNGRKSSNGLAPTLEAMRPPMMIEHHPGYKDAEFKTGLSPTLAAGRRTRLRDGTATRYITIEEAKILQGFPDWFQINEYRVIGNSVSPPMARAVGEHVASLLKAATLDADGCTFAQVADERAATLQAEAIPA